MSDQGVKADKCRWSSRTFIQLEYRPKLYAVRSRLISYGSIGMTLVLITGRSAVELIRIAAQAVAILIVALIASGFIRVLSRKLARAGELGGLMPKSRHRNPACIPGSVFVAIAGPSGGAGGFPAANRLLSSGCVVITALVCVKNLLSAGRT